jgi:hypothetical protein
MSAIDNVIIQKPEGVLVIDNQRMIEIEDEKFRIYELLRHPKYEPILNALKEGPLTVEELEEKYNKIAKSPKSAKTLYRYLKFLEKAGLVMNAGQQLLKDQNATRVLYSRTASIFYPSHVPEDLWECDFCQRVLEGAAKIISLKEGVPKQTKENIKKIMSVVDQHIFDELSDIFEKNSREASEIFLNSSSYETSRINHVASILLLLLNPSVYEKQVKEIFNK